MTRLHPIVLLACATALTCVASLSTTRAADETPIEASVSVDAGQTLRTMNPRMLGGTNVAMWYLPSAYESPDVRRWLTEMRPGTIRLPGGSWSNVVYWNGNGVRGADGKVDPSRVGPDGYPAVDYSAYAPSFLADSKTLHPASGNWHGNVDVKTQQDFIKALPGVEPFVCPNLGTGRPIDAAEWVKWDNQTMGYNCHYWEIGNELGGSWEPGNELPFGKGLITAAMYTKRFNAMADAMRAVDPTIKIGGGAFAEEMIRDCGTNVDFVSIHAYPGSSTDTEAHMLADVRTVISREVGKVRGWIHQYQPAREKQIEIDFSEWNLGGGINNARLFSGLWSSVFLGEMATHGVDFANEWDCFSDLLYLTDHGPFARKAEYYALWLWNNYMGESLIPATCDSKELYTYASRSDGAVFVALINPDHDRAANVNVRLAGFTPAEAGERATVSSREYYWNVLTNRPEWSTGPRIEALKTGTSFSVTLAPFSMTYLRIPDQAHPELSPLAQKALAAKPPAPGVAELRFVMPDEMYVGDAVQGNVLAVQAGTDEPYAGTLAPATVSTSGQAELDRRQVRLAEDVGHFSLKPAAAGELTITAQSGELKATHRLLVKPSVPRPVVFWDFTNPPVTDREMFVSDFDLQEDLTQRANRAVARVDLAVKSAVGDNGNGLLKISRLPDDAKLNKANIRGLVVDVKTSPDFACADPNASIMVVMQSPANWWMKLGTIPLKDAKEWKTHQLAVQNEEYFKAMPSAMNVIFVLQASKPVKGSIYFDKVGFMVR